LPCAWQRDHPCLSYWKFLVVGCWLSVVHIALILACSKGSGEQLVPPIYFHFMYFENCTLHMAHHMSHIVLGIRYLALTLRIVVCGLYLVDCTLYFVQRCTVYNYLLLVYLFLYKGDQATTLYLFSLQSAYCPNPKPLGHKLVPLLCTIESSSQEGATLTPPSGNYHRSLTQVQGGRFE
jgi:hypothetical protein